MPVQKSSSAIIADPGKREIRSTRTVSQQDVPLKRTSLNFKIRAGSHSDSAHAARLISNHLGMIVAADVNLKSYSMKPLLNKRFDRSAGSVALMHPVIAVLCLVNRSVGQYSFMEGEYTCAPLCIARSNEHHLLFNWLRVLQ